MTDKTWDAADPGDLPYRFCPSLTTGEVFILAAGHGWQVIGYLENYPAFHRFMVEGCKTDDLMQEGILKEAADILKAKQIGGA